MPILVMIDFLGWPAGNWTYLPFGRSCPFQPKLVPGIQVLVLSRQDADGWGSELVPHSPPSRRSWVTAHWNLAFAAFMFVIMVYFYSQNLMGGGDVKILAVAFLWTGIWCAFVFAVLMAIFAMVQVAAAKFGWLKVQKVGEQKRIPLAPSVAGALIICFMLGCLQPL
jgi:prepilin signal peptidase PulO-like enzyme (type II secretory pathway)